MFLANSAKPICVFRLLVSSQCVPLVSRLALGVNKELKGPESHVEPRGHCLVKTQKVEQVFKSSLCGNQKGKDIVVAWGEQREGEGKRRGSVKAAALLLGTSLCPGLVAILTFLCCEESSSSCQVQADGQIVSMRIYPISYTVLGATISLCRRERVVANMSTGLRIGRDRRVIQASASAVRSLLIR